MSICTESFFLFDVLAGDDEGVGRERSCRSRRERWKGRRRKKRKRENKEKEGRRRSPRPGNDGSSTPARQRTVAAGTLNKAEPKRRMSSVFSTTSVRFSSLPRTRRRWQIQRLHEGAQESRRRRWKTEDMYKKKGGSPFNPRRVGRWKRCRPQRCRTARTCRGRYHRGCGRG